jgi:hypothetical protein
MTNSVPEHKYFSFRQCLDKYGFFVPGEGGWEKNSKAQQGRHSSKM